MTGPEILASWRDTPTTRAITEFVAGTTTEGDPRYLPPAERVAVFDNDGTLWPEKPMPVQLDFVVRGFAAAAEEDPGLRQPTVQGGLRARPALAGSRDNQALPRRRQGS